MKSREEHERDAKAEADALARGLPPPTPQHFSDVEHVDVASVIKKWDPITNLRWQPGGRKQGAVATVDTNGVINFWEIPRAKEHKNARLMATHEYGNALSAVAFTSDGEKLMVGGQDKTLMLLDIEQDFGSSTLKPLTIFGGDPELNGKVQGHGLKVIGMDAKPDDPNIIVSAGLDRHILVWDIRAGTHPVNGIYGPELVSDSINISKDGNSILTGSHRSKHPLEIYDLRVGADAHANPVAKWDWRADEQAKEGGGRWTTCLLLGAAWDDWENKTIVAAGENENLARVYERSADPEAPLSIVGTLRGKEQAWWSACVSTDGRSAAFGSADGSVCMVDISAKR